MHGAWVEGESPAVQSSDLGNCEVNRLIFWGERTSQTGACLCMCVRAHRYERMLLEAEVKRQISHHVRLEELAGMMVQPFSFVAKEEERSAQREAIAAAAKDPQRFQVTGLARADLRVGARAGGTRRQQGW